MGQLDSIPDDHPGWARLAAGVAPPVHLVGAVAIDGRLFQLDLELAAGGAWLTVWEDQLTYVRERPRLPVDRQGRLVGSPTAPVTAQALQAVAVFLADLVEATDGRPLDALLQRR